MARKPRSATESAEGTPLQAVVRRAHICFERIVPDELDPERHVRRALRAEMMAAAGTGRRLAADEVGRVTRMAVVTSKKWGPGFKLRCRFLDGSPKMQKKVRTVAEEWQKHANVKLQFIKEGPAEVRISFYADDGSWSAVGRDALNAAYFPLHQPTMNFGWVRDDSDSVEDRAVILHEFGHALGCIHEHQTPTFDRKWNEAAVMKYFKGPPNYWDEDGIRQNVLMKYSPKGIKATQFDAKSIMLYSFDAQLFSDGRGPTNQNSRLSPTDQTMVKKMYPG
ncbi:M12 family metallopeptidase [Polaromonas sp. YR568]|uniref:M12 family metallopeptidase n=1 Tax=Polaromonas sp. YR568 TaxID=1855301 RepID=UPI00398C09A8